MIAQLSIASLRLEIAKTIDPEASSPQADCTQDRSNLDAYQIALRLVKCMPTLQHIMTRYQFQDQERSPIRYRSVTHDGENWEMQEKEPYLGMEPEVMSEGW